MTKAGRAGGARRTGSGTRKVLVTGGSSGIGAATALAFAARGFPVAVTGLDDGGGLREVASQAGGVSIPGDLRERGCPRRVVEAAAEALGGLDVVVSNAGEGWPPRAARRRRRVRSPRQGSRGRRTRARWPRRYRWTRR